MDVIGDVHGCAVELRQLLALLGYQPSPLPTPVAPFSAESWAHPEGRKAIFVGDLVDRGPAILDVLSIVHNMIAGGHARSVMGNHDDKLARWLTGRRVVVSYGLEDSIAELEPLLQSGRNTVRAFLESLPLHLELTPRIIVVHACYRPSRNPQKFRSYALYGVTTGETDARGLPIRLDWAATYTGPEIILYGHTPTPNPRWVHNTMNLDTGCVFGGELTALRLPENELVSVPSTTSHSIATT